MWSATRHQKILAILKQHKQLSTDGLAAEFNVSRETIRRDFLLLEAQGSIDRIHGGAVLAKSVSEEPFLQRMNANQKEKRAISKLATELIKPGQSIFVDAGTTTTLLASELRKVPELMVITNSIDIASNLFNAKSQSKVFLVGGQMLTDVPATYGELTLAEIKRFNVDIAFIAPVSINSQDGAAYYELHEAEVAQAMLKQSDTKIILADHSKLGKKGRVTCCFCNEIDILISGNAANPDIIEEFRKSGISEIILAK